MTEAPKVLGVEMRHVENKLYELRLGALTA